MLVCDLDIRVIAEGVEVLRHLTLDPEVDYQGRSRDIVRGLVCPGNAETEHGRPRQDLNLRTRLRRPVLYPLSYGGETGRPDGGSPVQG
jgi:hypothetical protein